MQAWKDRFSCGVFLQAPNGQARLESPHLHCQGGVAFPAKIKTVWCCFLEGTWYQPDINPCIYVAVFFLTKNPTTCLFFAMKLPVTFLLEGTSSKNGTSLNIQVSFRLHLGGKSSSGDPRILLRGRGSCCCSSFTVLEMLQLHPWKLTWNPQNWELEPMLFLFQMEHFQCPC